MRKLNEGNAEEYAASQTGPVKTCSICGSPAVCETKMLGKFYYRCEAHPYTEQPEDTGMAELARQVNHKLDAWDDPSRLQARLAELQAERAAEVMGEGPWRQPQSPKQSGGYTCAEKHTPWDDYMKAHGREEYAAWDKYCESMAAPISIEIYQRDWIPGFAAYYPSEGDKPHVVLNLGSMLAAVASGALLSRDLPYMVAERLMHEVIHVLEKWANVEFNEERVESLLMKYREFAGCGDAVEQEQNKAVGEGAPIISSSALNERPASNSLDGELQAAAWLVNHKGGAIFWSFKLVAQYVTERIVTFRSQLSELRKERDVQEESQRAIIESHNNWKARAGRLEKRLQAEKGKREALREEHGRIYARVNQLETLVGKIAMLSYNVNLSKLSQHEFFLNVNQVLREDIVSYSICIKCHKMVTAYKKYCESCVKRYGLKQDENYHKPKSSALLAEPGAEVENDAAKQ